MPKLSEVWYKFKGLNLNTNTHEAQNSCHYNVVVEDCLVDYFGQNHQKSPVIGINISSLLLY